MWRAFATSNSGHVSSFFPSFPDIVFSAIRYRVSAFEPALPAPASLALIFLSSFNPSGIPDANSSSKLAILDSFLAFALDLSDAALS